jgi:hypothetical protein
MKLWKFIQAMPAAEIAGVARAVREAAKTGAYYAAIGPEFCHAQAPAASREPPSRR